MLDKILTDNNLGTDVALSTFLGISPPVISKIRHCRAGVGASLIIRIHEVTAMPVREIKGLCEVVQ